MTEPRPGVDPATSTADVDWLRAHLQASQQVSDELREWLTGAQQERDKARAEVGRLRDDLAAAQRVIAEGIAAAIEAGAVALHEDCGEIAARIARSFAAREAWRKTAGGYSPPATQGADCPCFYFRDDGDRTKTCVCGHRLDDHDEFGECEAALSAGGGDRSEGDER